MQRALLLLLPLAALAQPVAGQMTADSVLEPSSKRAFPVQITAADGTSQVLTGTGIRTKTFLKVKVYAFGIYVAPDQARAALSAWAGNTARDLERDDTFYARLLQMDLPMSLRLVMTRDVGGDDMAEAFDGALRPRVQQAAAERNLPGGEQALETFRGFFDVEEMTKESELLFTCFPDGRMVTRIKGEMAPELTSQALCWALFDVYLGEDPISGGGKKSVIGRIPALLSGG